MRRRRLRFTGQLLVLQLAVVAAVVLVGFGLFATMLDRGLRTGYSDRALAIARSMAADDEVRALVAGYSADHRAGPDTASELERGPIQRDAEAVRQLTGALFVVVTDDRGIRLAHPQPAELGRPVSTDPSIALAGREEIVEQRGTLGESARAKVPVLAPGGTDVVGAVSVGIGTDEISAALWSDLRVAALYAAAALGLGVFASILLSRRLRRLTLGVEPEELAAMASEHEAVLGSISEAVVGVDPRGRIGVANGEARRLFGERVRPGEMADEVGLPDSVLTAIRRMSARPAADRVPTDPFLVLAGERVLICSVGGVTRDGRDLGVVLSARDRTDVEALTRQLDAVQTMGSALRAQRHEFANRLHVVHGLLDHGHLQEATEYVRSVLGTGPLGTLLGGLETVRDPTLQAFLAAKAAHARECSVTLRLGPGKKGRGPANRCRLRRSPTRSGSPGRPHSATSRCWPTAGRSSCNCATGRPAVPNTGSTRRTDRRDPVKRSADERPADRDPGRCRGDRARHAFGVRRSLAAPADARPARGAGGRSGPADRGPGCAAAA